MLSVFAVGIKKSWFDYTLFLTRQHLSFHYDNMPMQYVLQFLQFEIFLIFAQNIDRGYTLEPL